MSPKVPRTTCVFACLRVCVCMCVLLQFKVIFSLSRYVFSTVLSWMMNNNQVSCNEVNSPKSIKAELHVLFQMSVCVRVCMGVYLLVSRFTAGF